MKAKTGRFLPILALFFAPLVTACAPTSIPPSIDHPLIDLSAPRFHETALNDREVGIPTSDRTRITVVDFWASWCEGCRETIPALDDLWRERRHDGVLVIGVSVDEDPRLAEQAARDLGASFPIVVSQNVGARYGVGKIPLTFVIDSANTVRWVGRDPRAMRRAVEFLLRE